MGYQGKGEYIAVLPQWMQMLLRHLYLRHECVEFSHLCFVTSEVR